METPDRAGFAGPSSTISEKGVTMKISIRDWRIWWVAIWLMAWVVGVAPAGAQDIDDGTFFSGWDAPVMLENWKIISAFLLPLVMGVIIQSNWSRALQALSTFVVSVIWTVIKHGIEGGFSGLGESDIIPTAMTIFALTIPFYYGLWQPTGIAKSIEHATNITEGAKRVAAMEATSTPRGQSRQFC
jgi:hypothetical protein